MKNGIGRIIWKTGKVIGITIISILIIIFTLPYIFPGFVSDKIKVWTNKSINGELNFSKARLSFFKHFPSLTLTLYDCSLKGSAPFEKDTLVKTNELSFGIGLGSVFSKSITINEIYLTQGYIHILVDEKGNPNYNVYKSDTTAHVANPADSSSASLKIERIQIDKTDIVYDDKSIPLFINAKGANYLGKGDLAKAVFDLASHLHVDSLDLDYNKTRYINSKKINADLVTKINTNSLALAFEKNDLKLNDLPMQFNGVFEFLKNGYKMDFKLQSKETDLKNIFSALPPEYLTWSDKTKITGFGDIYATLRGDYIAETNTMPDLAFNMKVRNGMISNNNAPSPIKNLYLNFESKLVQLNTDSLHVNVDSIYFNIDKDYFSSIIRLTGLKEPQIYAKINSEIDLEKWDKAMGLEPYDLKGRMSLHLLADGKYAKGVVKKGLRGVDTVITSIPKFSLDAKFRDGYFKYASLPQAVNNISFDLKANCPDHVYQNTKLSLENINANVLSNYIKGYFRMANAKDFPVDASIQSVFHLSDIKSFYPLDSMTLAGDLNIDVKTKGKYVAAKRLFPVTTAKFTMDNGMVQTKYYPHPLEKIQVDATITNTAGNMRSLNVNLKPVSFLFEGQPFVMKADLKNFDDLRYNVFSNGVIDLGKIYKVFAVKGYDLKGFIQTNLALRGTQSDAVAGRYDQLNNKGTLKIKDIAITSDLFPKPLEIKTGVFHFEQDKMWFDEFKANYSKSYFTLNGYLSNVIAYATQQNAPLRGNFDLKSDYIIVDEFMAFADNKSASTAKKSSSPTGVIIVPSNLSLVFTADVKKIKYDALNLTDFKGGMRIDSGYIILDKTGFQLVGTKVSMDAKYGSVTPTKAIFDYHISAKDFDVKRAYNEVKMFHDMAPSAASAEGIISLDYKIGGKLDANMSPIYPSLKGGGVLSLEKVKIKGLKLFSAVSKATNRDSVNNPSLSKVDIKSTIANNILTIERTKMKVFGFRPRFEGQVSLDGKLNLSGRLGLPPFGIFGIPFTVVGTQSDPKVKLRRNRDSDKLDEEKEEE